MSTFLTTRPHYAIGRELYWKSTTRDFRFRVKETRVWIGNAFNPAN